MVLGAPLLSISKNADEWLAYSNDNVTLLLSFTKNVFNGDTECYCGVRYFQLSQLVELRRIRSAIFPPNEKASCAEYVAPGFCCITSAALLPKSLGSPFGLTVVANIMHFGGLSMSVTSVAYSGDTECYPSLALMVHSVFLLAWSHSEMESSSTHSVYSFESVETTVIVISCGRANSGLELISALDKALPMFDLRDTESPLHSS